MGDFSESIHGERRCSAAMVSSRSVDSRNRTKDAFDVSPSLSLPPSSIDVSTHNMHAVAKASSFKISKKFKRKNPDLKIDKWISISMIITGFLMITLPIILTNSIDIVLVVFGIVGMIFSVKDLVLYKNPDRLRKGWLKLHLGKMLGGYIAATTAFVVVNQFFPSFYGWFIPGIVGALIIAYWSKKINKKTKTVPNTLQN